MAIDKRTRKGPVDDKARDDHERWCRWNKNLNSAAVATLADEIPDYLKFQRFANDRILGTNARPAEIQGQETPDRQTLTTKFKERLGGINDLLKEETDVV